MQARAESIGKDSVTAFLQADLEALRTRVPDLESRSRLREQINHLSQRNASLVAQMAELQGKLARQNKERVASEARESDVEHASAVRYTSRHLASETKKYSVCGRTRWQRGDLS